MFARLRCFLVMGVLVTACNLSEPDPRTIRAHTVVLEGVAHGAGHQRAERYCVRCHGVALAGGDTGEPSCYQCHGVNWPQTGNLSGAPVSHTIDNGGWIHHPGFLSPNASCATSGCHGTDLGGDAEFGTPSCTLCHGELWNP